MQSISAVCFFTNASASACAFIISAMIVSGSGLIVAAAMTASHRSNVCPVRSIRPIAPGQLKRPAIHAEKMQIAGLAYERRDDAIEVGDVVIAVDDAAAVHQMFIPQVVDKKPFDRAAEMVVANAVRTLVKRDQCSVSLLLRRVVLSLALSGWRSSSGLGSGNSNQCCVGRGPCQRVRRIVCLYESCPRSVATTCAAPARWRKLLAIADEVIE